MDIPQLPWFKVLLLIAKHSSEDLYSMAGTCKVFQEMLNHREVWRTVSIKKYPWHEEWYGFHEGKIAVFLQKCKEHNYPKITYREAFHHFFICNDDEVVNNMRVAGMAGHMESCYIVGLLGLLHPSKGKEDAMEFLCHLSKTKKIDMQACRDSIMDRLLRYSLGVVTPPTLAKFTADQSYFEEDCIDCEGNQKWYLAFEPRESGINPESWNCCEPCKWKRELYYFQRCLSLRTTWI